MITLVTTYILRHLRPAGRFACSDSVVGLKLIQLSTHYSVPSQLLMGCRQPASSRETPRYHFLVTAQRSAGRFSHRTAIEMVHSNRFSIQFMPFCAAPASAARSTCVCIAGYCPLNLTFSFSIHLHLRPLLPLQSFSPTVVPQNVSGIITHNGTLFIYFTCHGYCISCHSQMWFESTRLRYTAERHKLFIHELCRCAYSYCIVQFSCGSHQCTPTFTWTWLFACFM